MLIPGKKFFIVLSTNMATLSHGRKLHMHYNLVPRVVCYNGSVRKEDPGTQQPKTNSFKNGPHIKCKMVVHGGFILDELNKVISEYSQTLNSKLWLNIIRLLAKRANKEEVALTSH